MGATTWNRFKGLVRQAGDLVRPVAAATVLGLYWAPAAFAQTGTGFAGDHSGAICALANYYKEIIGGVALIAGIVWFVGYVNKKESLTDLAQTVIIGCIVVGALSYLIGLTGLTLPTGC
ncbi:hypothetical protein GALL_531050 [mine drainage metagenome]|uniref:TrbC/VIRB2 family protein n=1 Tax=mine drainage metagenome TaxID=410659 RepID=A0A1J5P1D2_9ZZZZ